MRWYVDYEGRCPVSELIGKTLASIDRDEEQIKFTTTNGEHFLMYHEQGCCESVEIESIVGDLSDLIGEPMLVAEEVNSDNTPAKNPYDPEEYTGDESFTWTFYKFATRKGYVDVRWYGRSNGYYSESVDFGRVKNEDE